MNQYVLSLSEYAARKDEQIIALDESFFHRKEDNLENLLHAVNSFYVALKDMNKEHHAEFFRKLISDDLNAFTKDIASDYSEKLILKLARGLDEIIDEVDDDLTKSMGLHKLRDELRNSIKSDEPVDIQKKRMRLIFDSYSKKLDDGIDNTVDIFAKKVRKNERYITLKNGDIIKSKVSSSEFKSKKYFLQIELLKMQEWVAKHKKKILVILEGRDASGKSACVRTITENLNPKYYKSVKISPEILSHVDNKEWMDKFRSFLPRSGEIVFFDRSWYSKAYVEPAMGYCTESEYEYVMDNVNAFEDSLMKDDEIILIKIWMSISQKVQKLKFQVRLSDPLKYWKFSENDKKSIDKWDDYTKYINKMFKRTDRTNSPWIIIDADDSREAKIECIERLLELSGYRDIRSASGNEKKRGGEVDVIFLDIDGPLIPFKTEHMENHADFYNNKKWNKDAIDYINDLVDKTGAKVVITSQYRLTKSKREIESQMRENGFDYEVYGVTPSLIDKSRG